MSFAKCSILGTFVLSLVSAQSLTIINSDFSVVPVRCTVGYAYEPPKTGGNCQVPNEAYQDFNHEPGIGWFFAPLNTNIAGESNGITRPNTAFNPPSFSGLPFTQAALLQGPTSLIDQQIDGFLPEWYVLSFYLGSRYASGGFDGNQTVVAKLDGQVIGIWKLASFTPFTLRKALFNVTSPGTHLLTFRGTASGDHTAFLSGVSIAPAQ